MASFSEKTREEKDVQASSPRLLLHACCGPCAAGCAMRLAEEGRDFLLYYSNSNLADEAEYEKRLTAVRLVAEHCAVPLEIDPYDHVSWLAAVSRLKDYEFAPERGARCRLCFEFSLARTARLAEKLALPFATSLTISPHKSSALIFEIGSAWPFFEPWDFKKKDGFRKSLATSCEWGLYRQDFCGCEFSRAARMKKTAEDSRNHN